MIQIKTFLHMNSLCQRNLSIAWSSFAYIFSGCQVNWTFPTNRLRISNVWNTRNLIYLTKFSSKVCNLANCWLCEYAQTLHAVAMCKKYIHLFINLYGNRIFWLPNLLTTSFIRQKHVNNWKHYHNRIHFVCYYCLYLVLFCSHCEYLQIKPLKLKIHGQTEASPFHFALKFSISVFLFET